MSNIETAMNVSKVAIALDHLRNNRIEYLILLLISHMVGVTGQVVDKAQGMCLWLVGSITTESPSKRTESWYDTVTLTVRKVPRN